VVTVEVKLVLLIKEETVDPEEEEELILPLLQVLLVAQEMFLTQLQPLQDYKATTEEMELEVLEKRKLEAAVAEPVKLEQV
jgi:hypothetical protein